MTTRRKLSRLLLLAQRMRGDSRGVAAIEFAFITGFLSVAALNVADVGLFLFDRLQVENAAEMGVQAVWASCDLNHTPVTNKCTGYSSAMTNAVHSTSLGSHISVSSGYPTEGYYCVNSSGALVSVSDVNNKPADCSSVGNANAGPGDYMQVQVTYTYAPMFGFTVASLLPTTITELASLRMA